MSPSPKAKRSPRKLKRNARKSPKSKKKTPKFRLIGGDGNCLNNHTPGGLPIDPITLNSIPLNKIIRVPLSWIEDPDTLVITPDPNTDYHCFNQTSLLEWLQKSMKNPLNNQKFSSEQGFQIFNQIKGKRFVLPNGFVSPFSTYGPVSEEHEIIEENPIPKGLFCILNPWAEEYYFPEED